MHLHVPACVACNPAVSRYCMVDVEGKPPCRTGFRSRACSESVRELHVVLLHHASMQFRDPGLSVFSTLKLAQNDEQPKKRNFAQFFDSHVWCGHGALSGTESNTRRGQEEVVAPVVPGYKVDLVHLSTTQQALSGCAGLESVTYWLCYLASGGLQIFGLNLRPISSVSRQSDGSGSSDRCRKKSV